jgi:hypothetical protein
MVPVTLAALGERSNIAVPSITEHTRGFTFFADPIAPEIAQVDRERR